MAETRQAANQVTEIWGRKQQPDEQAPEQEQSRAPADLSSPKSPKSAVHENAEKKKRCKARKGVWHEWKNGGGSCVTTVHLQQQTSDASAKDTQ